ncbi:MAG: tRNA pseudouridine(54/55) synthase Pus10 [Methanobrevibacter sp.]|nr:tRNA pseudouridine(54/55) synthase Pus10 [Methanobrevibacter sp.]
MQILEEILEKTDGRICKHCLGRMLSKTIEGEDNFSRAESLNIELNENECIICGNVFNKIDDELFNKIYDKLDFLKVEFDSFVVGSRIDNEIKQRDEEFIKELNLDVEPIKKEINRIIGKKLENELKKEVNFEKQDIIVNVNLIKNPKVRIQINPIFIEGKYNKLVRGIPQTKWPCRKCKGRGCEECNFTGKQYPCSVEELISEHILKATNGYEAKFHGAGREDIDVLMLGSGRPFVLEIKEPKIRKIDLNNLEKEINDINRGKTQYHNLKFTNRNRKAEIKVSSPDAYKIYNALVECDSPYDKDKLAILSELNEIHQQTPIRVSHRRADKVRIKHVLDLSCEVIDETHFEMTIKTEGGLYIKELISGDEGRSQPNVTDKLGVKAFCKQLDVIEVSDK